MARLATERLQRTADEHMGRDAVSGYSALIAGAERESQAVHVDDYEISMLAMASVLLCLRRMIIALSVLGTVAGLATGLVSRRVYTSKQSREDARSWPWLQLFWPRIPRHPQARGPTPHDREF